MACQQDLIYRFNVLKRILKSQAVTRILVYVIKFYVLLLYIFCKVEVRFDNTSRGLIANNQVCFFSYWHSRILIFPKFMTNLGRFSAVISSHGDGEYLNQVIKSYGHQTIRGSSRKDSFKALIGIIRLLKQGVSLGITPDGPKGPRFKIKGAIATLAAKFNIPVIPITYSASHAIVLKTWDRFVLPIPLRSRIIIEIGAPIYFSEKKRNGNLKIEKLMLAQTVHLDKELGLITDYT